MKKMSKEEAIERFIILLGDNKVLGKYFTLEEIRKVLNENLKKVTFIEETEGNIGGGCSPYGEIEIVVPKNATNEYIERRLMHELLHCLSSNTSTIGNIRRSKMGLEVKEINDNGIFEKDDYWVYSEDKTARVYGKGLNEGITELLLDEILRPEPLGYEDEKDISRIILALVGEETILKKYFAKLGEEEKIKKPILYYFNDYFKTLEGIDRLIFYDETKTIIDNMENMAILKFNYDGDVDNYEDSKLYVKWLSAAYGHIGKLTNTYIKKFDKSDDYQSKIQNITNAINSISREEVKQQLKGIVNIPDFMNTKRISESLGANDLDEENER